ncbi:MAG: hypothetical protein MJE77_18305 [Proteobacteria bacterium]|nr:hypothetical protein [Pseudomonadota bacterium]
MSCYHGIAGAVSAAVVLFVVSPGFAQSFQQSSVTLREAARAVERGDYQRGVELVVPLLAPPGGETDIDLQDRAEGWRIYGLAQFFLNRLNSAERAFLEYLKLDVEARLDPALVPPEAIVFFENVRSRHAAELRKYRPRPKPARPKRYRALNLLPPFGQFQNRHRKKGWIMAGTGLALLATHVSTYAILRAWCDPGTGVCQSDGESRTGASRALRTLNISTGIALLGLFAYGIADGFLYYRAVERDADQDTERARRSQIGLAPAGPLGAQVVLRGQF